MHCSGEISFQSDRLPSVRILRSLACLDKSRSIKARRLFLYCCRFVVVFPDYGGTNEEK